MIRNFTFKSGRVRSKVARANALALLSLATFGLSGIAQAVPIALTFEPFAGTSSDSDLGPLPNPFSESGFDFTFNSDLSTPHAGLFFIGAEAPCVSACTSNGTAAFYNFNTSTLSLTRSNHGTFSLLQLDAAQAFMNLGSPLELHVDGLLSGGGTVSTVFNATPSAANSFASFALPSTFANLLSVTFSGSLITEDSTSNFALDNLVVDPLPEKLATPIAEPMSAALFGIGLLGFATRRRLIRR